MRSGRRQIASRHTGQSDAEQTVADRIGNGNGNGGSGQLGPRPMPPTDVDEQQALKLARRILSRVPAR